MSAAVGKLAGASGKFCEWPRLLKRIGGLEHEVVAVAGADDLEAAGQSRVGEPGRHGGRGVAGEVEGIGIGDPVGRLALDLGGDGPARAERLRRERGREEQVVLIEEPRRPGDELAPAT